MIFNHGIFAQIGENIKILIPSSILNGKFLAKKDNFNGPVFEIKQSNQNSYFCNTFL